MRKISVVLAAAAVAAAIGVWAPWASSAVTGYEPVLDPADFTTTIDNPYFPLPVGRTLVYRGVKDGQSQIDTVTVTNQTKLVAEGITARVVTDVATHDGQKLEETSDWYAQDDKGNVWYVGEDTKAYLPNGKVDTSGSWEAGVHDAARLDVRGGRPPPLDDRLHRGEASNRGGRRRPPRPRRDRVHPDVLLAQ